MKETLTIKMFETSTRATGTLILWKSPGLSIFAFGVVVHEKKPQGSVSWIIMKYDFTSLASGKEGTLDSVTFTHRLSVYYATYFIFIRIKEHNISSILMLQIN